MLKNNLKIASRNLTKSKAHSFINIFGLALGIAAFAIISLYVSYEKSYDTFRGSGQVYRVSMDYKEGGEFVPGDAQTYNLSGPTLKKDFPEIIEQVRLHRIESISFLYGDKVLEQSSGLFADPSYFDIFNNMLLEGKRADFNRPNTIILTESVAQKIFGNKNPLGEIVSVFLGSEALLEVVGIMPDAPENTHMKAHYLISYETLKTWDAMEGQYPPNWNQNNFFTYIKIADQVDAVVLQKKIIASDFQGSAEERHNIEPITDIHLYSDKPYEAEANGSIGRVRFLSAIAIIIIVLSWLNYVNLSTAKSMERSKEVGIRKVVGAQRFQLIVQSLIESLSLNVIALILAIGLTFFLLPMFNNFVEKSLFLGLANINTLLPLVGFVIIGTLLSGLYPAFVISGYKPIKALKGKVRASRSDLGIRKGLITLQFFATAVLIISTLLVGKQIQFLREQPTGIDLAQVIALKGEILEAQSDSLSTQKIGVLESQLKQLSFVSGVTQSTTYPGDTFDNLPSTVGIDYPDGTSHDNKLFYWYRARPEYFDLIALNFVAGEAFLPESSDIVLNETFARQMGFTNPEEIIGKTVKFWGSDLKISGVVADYHHFGLKNKILPIIIRPMRGFDNLLVKINNSSIAGMENNLAQLKTQWKSVFPNSTLNYTFLDKNFEAQYREDQKFGSIFKIFTALAIFIAALGLFGLTSYTILQRRKEIGVRKVSGATVFQIVKLLNMDFLKWVGIAFALAIPVSWYIMSLWLDGFAFKTVMSWWIFAIAGIIAFLVALVSVSFQAIKAAVANPVKSLRTE